MLYRIVSTVPEAFVLLARALQVEALARDELHDRGDPVDRNDCDLPFGIDRDAAPVSATDVRRQHQRALTLGA